MMRHLDQLTVDMVNDLVARGVPLRKACDIVRRKLVPNANHGRPPYLGCLAGDLPAPSGCKIIDLDQVRRNKQSK